MTQIQLIEPPRPCLQPRPNLNDAYIVRDAAKSLLPHVMIWLRQGNDRSTGEEVLEDLIAMIEAAARSQREFLRH